MSTIAPELDRCDFGVTTGHAASVRLCEDTRRLAARYLAGDFGRAMVQGAIRLPKDIAVLTPDLRHAAATRCIAEQAPLRVRADEWLLGTSTLREAIWHTVPGLDIGSTSHTTVGFTDIVREGLAPLRRRISERLTDPGLDAVGRDFLLAAQSSLESLVIWHRRNLAELELVLGASRGVARERLARVHAAASRAPEEPARGFHEALQALWTQWEFLRLCGDWSGIGRIDRILGPYLDADLAAGVLTLDEAREMLAHFWIKGCGWIGANDKPGSGDAQFYQNIILAGIAPDGSEVENAVTHLVLDIVDELHISDFPIAVRVSARTSPRLWRRMAEVQRRGGGIVSFYNEDLVIASLTEFGIPLADARDFTNDGCWETLIPGRTAFGYRPFDALQLLQNALGLDGSPVPEARDFEAVYAAFRSQLNAHMERFHADTDWAFSKNHPAPLLSLFVSGCIERARGYNSNGADYQFCAPHAGGLPDVANSLLAIRHLVFEQQRLTLAQLVEILRADWAGHEALRAEVQRSLTLYGNGDSGADDLLRRVFDDFTAAASSVRLRKRVHRPAGISTFGRELSFRGHRQATAFGAKRGAILASNLAPTPGSERQGPTAVIRSYCCVDFRRLPNGTPLDLKLFPGDLAGEAGIQMLIGLEKTFLELGGWYMQVDVVDAAVLRDAQAHPERHANLAVRISGWSARFTTLDHDWQQLVIARCEHRMRSG